MLFNTLAYARFFAIVFLGAWLLVNRRWAPLLPWFAVAGYAAFGAPTWIGAAITLVALLATLVTCRGEAPTRLRAAVAVGLNYAALFSITWRFSRTEPVALALRALDVPLGRDPSLAALLAVGAAWLAYRIVVAERVRLLFLLAASYVFYAHWDYRFLPLIFASSTIDWLLANAIARARSAGARKLWLVGTVALNLGVLGVFKYFNFGIDAVSDVLGSFGYHPPEVALRIALPIGISFFTFESMSYVIDVYRGDIEPHESYAEYLSFVAFFPHLVAGPIVRPRDLLPQLGGPARWNPAEGSEGLFLIAVGLLKKVAIGDYLALNLVDRIFDAPAQFSSLECYAATLGYAVQIYCDFSGYTDIAIGSALLLGIRFPKNFDAPYKATNIQDFWRRWHISLSTWLRDYLYVPLGGNRKGAARTYANLLITMVLGGLWHGAAWTFVVWGALHGIALAVTRAYQRSVSRRSSPSWSGRLLGVVATFHFVCAAWIFFRAENFQKAHVFFTQLTMGTTFTPNLPPIVLTVLAVGLVSHFVPERWYALCRETFARLPAPAQGLTLFGAAWILGKMSSAEAVPFVYFQF